MQYVGSTATKFRLRYNNYKNCYHNHSLKTVPQQSFHNHFSQQDHNGMEDWSIKLIDHADNDTLLRKQESYWQNKLNTFVPLGLNEREVTYDVG